MYIPKQPRQECRGYLGIGEQLLGLNWGDYYSCNSMKENGLALIFNAKGSPLKRTLQPVQA